MKKIYYWSPHISNVATIKNVINSAISIKKFSKKKVTVKIIDVVGEWNNFRYLFKLNNIELIKFSGLNLKKYFPIVGFFKSRLIYLLVFIFKIKQLKNLITNEKPDFLIVHLITIVPLFLFLFFNFKTKLVLRISGLPKLTMLRKIFWKMASKKINLITCPSEETKNDMLKLNIFNEEKLKILYDPIINVNLIKSKINKKIIHKITNKNYLVNIGRLTKQKNQIMILKAFSEVLKSNKNLSLLIAGDGEEKKSLNKYIKLHNLDKNIFLLGHVENVYPVISNSLALISSSIWEDPGAAMIEAAFCNTPIISSNCPNGPKEFIDNNKAGYLYKNQSIVSLLESLNEFLKDDKTKVFNKKIQAKRKCKNYTIFQHFNVINKILND